jgi:hypothetical protein
MRIPVASLAVGLLVVATVVGRAHADAPVPAPFPAEIRRVVPVVAAPRVELVDEGVGPLPTFVHEGRRFVQGDSGQRYRIRIVNPTPARVEAVISVDGLDAVDGRPAAVTKRGYVIAAFDSVTIDGWRTSLDTVAAFRFASVRESYAARTGRDRNVGVIGVAFFRERAPIAWRSRGSAPSGASADAAGAPSKAPSAQRPGLGTEFGESHDSHVSETTFIRAEASPGAVSELRYDDREGLIARGISIPSRDWRQSEIDLRTTAEAFPGSRFAQPPR